MISLKPTTREELVICDQMDRQDHACNFVNQIGIEAHYRYFDDPNITYLNIENNSGEFIGYFVLVVEPELESLEFRRYIKAFGHELALSDSSPLKIASGKGGGGESGEQIGLLLRKALPDLDEADYRRRMEAAIMLCSASMYHQARQQKAFRGHQSELFLHSLIDALVGLLGAPVSTETLALKEEL